MKEVTKLAQETAKQIVADPDKGLLTIANHLDFVDGTETRVKIRDFAPLTTDEPEEFGGQNHGPNPIEYLVTGIVGCLSTTTRIFLQNAGIHVDALSADLESTLDMAPFFNALPTAQRGIYDIRIKLHIKADATKERLEEIVHEAVLQSPGVQSVKSPVRVVVIKD